MKKSLSLKKIRTEQVNNITNIQRQATLGGSKTGMESPAAQNTTSYIGKIPWIIMKERLANKEASPATVLLALEILLKIQPD